MTPRIAWLPGDGIGPEVLAAAREVLDAVELDAEHVDGQVGWELWCREGQALPGRTLELLGGCDAALLGAITSKPVAEAERELEPGLRGTGRVYRSPIVALRQELNLFACVRPCRDPRAPRGAGLDLVVYRENTEGLYCGLDFHPLAGELRAALARHPRMAPYAEVPDGDLAVSVRLVSRQRSEAIARAAFEAALRRPRRRLTLAEKPNVLRATGGLFRQAARTVSADFPSVDYREENADAVCAGLVQHPERYDVLLAGNLFGDLLSDLGAGLTGGLGLAPSANLSDRFGLFEPSHGSAPDIAGRGTANPTAAILSAALMLDWLGQTERAERVRRAVRATLLEGAALTPDLGGAASTTDFTRAVCAQLHTPVHGTPTPTVR